MQLDVSSVVQILYPKPYFSYSDGVLADHYKMKSDRDYTENVCINPNTKMECCVITLDSLKGFKV